MHSAMLCLSCETGMAHLGKCPAAAQQCDTAVHHLPGKVCPWRAVCKLPEKIESSVMTGLYYLVLQQMDKKNQTPQTSTK
jgi:hypothetical protein